MRRMPCPPRPSRRKEGRSSCGSWDVVSAELGRMWQPDGKEIALGDVGGQCGWRKGTWQWGRGREEPNAAAGRGSWTRPAGVHAVGQSVSSAQRRRSGTEPSATLSAAGPFLCSGPWVSRTSRRLPCGGAGSHAVYLYGRQLPSSASQCPATDSQAQNVKHTPRRVHLDVDDWRRLSASTFEELCADLLRA